jgi:hypothetical protein
MEATELLIKTAGNPCVVVHPALTRIMEVDLADLNVRELCSF